ncbi:low affinity high capacity ammonium permease [Sporothrix stenoceras]|uniref:Ammonium transporter n=1 Tax=Sporothrix stenoceras TaxID=5173 RepID=A0ABR3ZRN8_9PEZI
MSYSWIGAPAVFNGTDSGTGGDSVTENLNQWYQSGDQAFIIVASCMVLIMVPGIAFLYSGLARRKSALSLIWVCMMSFSVVVFQWYFWGYSLAFSSTATNGFIGDLHHFGLLNTLAVPSPGSPLIPELLYSFYQMQFCAVTAALVVGATAERGRVIPAMVFTFFWATIVYCPIACWVWNVNGWAFNYGVLDYAGGGPVEICSGVSALAYSWVLGRRNEKMMLNFRPHNISLITLGTILLWFGWLGFNGGSAFGANLRATMACWNSCLTAMFAAMTWCLLDFRLAKKWSLVGWCSGTISGLVSATPASGFVTPWASIILGIVTGIACNFATKVKFVLRIDDSLDVFAEHAVGGMVGLIFNAFFAADYIIGLDGVNNGMTGGFINHNWRQLYVQIAYLLACTFYAFTVSALLAKAIDLIPGLHLRASEEAELLGMDDDQHGEFAYDYVEVRRDYLAWTPAEKDPKEDGVRIIPQHGIEGHQMLMNGTRPPSLAAASTADQEERIYLNSQSSNGKERSLAGSNGNGIRPQLQAVSDQEDAVQSEKVALPPSPPTQ